MHISFVYALTIFVVKRVITKNMYIDIFRLKYAARAIMVWFQVPFKLLLFIQQAFAGNALKAAL